MCAAKGHVCFAPKADMCSALAHVRFGPKADIASRICIASAQFQDVTRDLLCGSPPDNESLRLELRADFRLPKRATHLAAFA
jgi:hypothetical protein